MKWLSLIFLAMPAIILAQGKMRMPPDYDEPEPRVIPESYFTVVAPYDIRQGYSYNIHIRGFHLDDPIRIVIRMNGTSDSGSPLNIRKTAVISRESSKASITIDTSGITKGNYALFVQAGDFSEKRTLTYITRSVSLFTLLNKAIFRPDELVQYKIFATNSETKSVTPKCANVVSIIDGNGNVIETTPNVTFSRGQYAGDFKLSEKAVHGVWSVQIQCDDEMVTKEFEVTDYVLPLVTGSLSVEPRTPYAYGKVPLSVDVSYPSGGDATGNATITIEKYGQNIFKRDILITSNSQVLDLDIVNDLQLTTPQYAYFQAHLVFHDEPTGNKVTDTKEFAVIQYLYTFEVPITPPLNPGNSYTFTIVMKKFDGTPAPTGSKISVVNSYPGIIPSQTLRLGSDGTVECTVNVPSDTRYISFSLTAKEASEGYFGASVPYRETGEFVQINILTERPSLSEKVEIKISSSGSSDFVMLHTVCQGLLRESTRVWFDDEEGDLKTVIYKVRTSKKCLPNFQVLAYYINENGDFISDMNQIRLTDLGNYLTVSPTENEVLPGGNIDLEIESYVGSTVSLAAIDYRVVMLRGGHNITKNNVYDELEKYTYYNVQYDYNTVASYEYTFGGAGLFVYTNIPRPSRRYRPDRPGRPERPSKPSMPEKMKPGKSGTKIREDFRDNFLWTDVRIRNYKYPEETDEYSSDYWKGHEVVSVNATEQLTTYLIYGISNSKSDGIGLPDDIASIDVFLPFSVNLELPYSVKKEESLQLDMFIFNYLKKGQNVDIRVKKDPKFSAVDLTKYGWKSITGFYQKNITTVFGKHSKVVLVIRPNKIGFVPIEITAKGPLAGDGIRKQLRVVQQGVPRYITTSALINLDADSNSAEFNTSLTCKLPNSAYVDTTEVSATVVGEIFGKALDNLDRLIHMPGGCGEQTMTTLAPNIAIMKYLNSANKMTVTLKTKLEQYIKYGIQNELSYQRTDGSFSAFGNSDPAGSTWLSAYVAKYFFYAKDFVGVDKSAIKRAADFVVAQQKTDGSFNEPGRVIHVDMQGGSGNGIAMTAYCASFLTIILGDYPEYETARDKAITYLETAASASSSTYELGVVTNAFIIAGSSKATQFFNLFNPLKVETESMTYWAAPAPANPTFWYYNEPRSTDIELSSYGLKIYIGRSMSLSKIMKIVNYLISKANNLGGYSSSQDTVMAFEALSEVASIFSASSDIDLELTPDAGSSISTTVDSSNAFTLQSFELDPNTRRLDVSATTSTAGIAVVTLICHFYEDPKKVIPVFNISYTFSFSCSSRITFNVCSSYIPKGSSNMAILTATMPSGFVYNEWYGMQNPDVSKVEVLNQGSKVVFYFNSIGNTDTCVTINAYRSKFVSDLKGGTLEVTDYYDTSKQGSTSYPVPDLSGPCWY